MIALIEKDKEVITPTNCAKVAYMKNISKLRVWNTKDRWNIEAFIMDYKTYFDASRYLEDDEWVQSLGSFLKKGVVATFFA